jgi:hypothetical protein
VFATLNRLAILSLGLFIVSLVSSVAAQVPSTSGSPATRNAVLIVAISPEIMVDGVETEVEVTVAYELNSHDKGLVELTSNALRSQSMSPFASQPVAKGSGTISIKGKLTPRFWNEIAPAKVGAFLVVSDGELTKRTAAASDQTRVTLTPRSGAPETQAKNPNPRHVYEDALRIKSISPDTFVAGQRVEVTVVISYELLSREAGEIGLGFSRGLSPGYSVASHTRVQSGKGELTLKGWVTPQRTGTLPFGKVHVNLVEYPRRERTAVLANDAETVEVK